MTTRLSRHLLASVLSIIVFVEPVSALAATRTWDAGGADDKWSTAANWSGDTVPTATDIALFDGTGKKDATIDAGFGGSVAELRLAAANTGTISVGRSFTVNNNFSLSGGTFAINGGNTVTVKGSWQNGGGTLTSNTGTVLLAGSGTSYVLKEPNVFKHLSLDDGMVGYWRFDDGPSATVAIDSSRQGNNAALNSFSPSNWTTSVPVALTGFTDPYSFTSTGGPFAQVTNHASLNPQRITIAAWAYPSVDNGCNTLWEQSNNAQNRLIYGIVTASTFNWRLVFTDSTVASINAASASPINAWAFVVTTYDGAIARLYINGVLSASYAKVGTLSYGGSSPHFRIGVVNGGFCPWIGSIDDVRFYNRSLSASEIQALYSGEQGTGSGRYTLASDITVNGDLNIYSGNLDASTSNYVITASGSFVNNARFTPRSGTVTLSGIRTHLKTYGTSLYNLAIAASKSAILRRNATVTNALSVNSSSTLALNGNTLTATNAEINNASTITLGSGSLLHRGTFSVSPAATAIGNSLAFTLADGDQNLDGTMAETVTVDVNGEPRLFTESTAASGIFQGTIGTSHAAPVANNGIVESDDRCGIFVKGTYHDPDDTSDIATVRAEVLDSAVPCEISAGGGGGRRIDRATAPSASVRPSAPTSPDISRSDSTLCSDVLGRSAPTKTRGEQQIVALCRRRDIVIRKGESAETLNERKQLNAIADFILGVIGRLKARM